MLKNMTKTGMSAAKRFGLCATLLLGCVVESLSAITVTGQLTQENVNEANGELTISGEVVVNEKITIDNALTIKGNNSAKIVSKSSKLTFDLRSGADNISFEDIAFDGSQRTGTSSFIQVTAEHTVWSFVNCTFTDCGVEGYYPLRVINGGGVNLTDCKFFGSVGEDVFVGTKYVNVKGNNSIKFRMKTRTDGTPEDGTPNPVHVDGELSNEEPMAIYYDLPDGCMDSEKTKVVVGCADVSKFVSGKSDLRVVPKGDNSLALIPKVDFDPEYLYTIKNIEAGKSLLLGEITQDYEVGLGLEAQVGGAKIEEGTSGYRILSPCGGVFVFKSVNYIPKPFVVSDQDYDMEIWPHDNYYAIRCFVKGGDGSDQYFLAYDDISAGYEIQLIDDLVDKALWEITKLPAGAIVDVPREVSVPNCAWKDGDEYKTSSVELTEDKGFACFHEVSSQSLKFTRVFKTGWQGLSVPFDLELNDFTEIGTVWQIDKAETSVDGTLALRLERAESVEANRPYLIYVNKPGTYTFTKYACQVYPHSQAETSVASTDNIVCELSCVYDFTEVPVSDDDSETKTYALSGGEFKRPQSDGIKLKPYRVLLTVTTSGAHPLRVAVKTDDLSGIDFDLIEEAPTNEQWYDLNGRPASAGARGLLISPSGKVIVR